MRKIDTGKLRELIEYEEESDYIDFKKEQYHKHNNEDLIKDIMSMANSDSQGCKYIIIGIKDDIAQEREVVGIDEVLIDDAVYQQLVTENIEPNISFSYLNDEIDGKKIAYIILDSNNIDKPYMIKKDNAKLKKGDAFKRIGSHQRRMIRRDYDEIYKDNTKFFLTSKKIDSYKSEIILIEKLKSENRYLIEKNQEIRNSIELYKESTASLNKHFIRNKLPEGMTLIEWQNKTLINIINFTIQKMDDNLINTLVEKINTDYISEYIRVISSLKDDFQYLRNLQEELRDIRKLVEPSERNRFELSIESTNTRDIFDHFENRFCKLLFQFDYNKRIEELKENIKEIE